MLKKQQISNKRLAHLKKVGFQPGQSGNPKGKPKGTISVVSLIKRVLKERAKTTDGQEKQRIEVLARNIVSMAISQGDKDMIKLILNYVDGMPRQPVETKYSGRVQVDNIMVLPERDK